MTPEAKPYWDGAREGKLMIPRCRACGKAFLYGIFSIIEAARQLRGECGARQVPGARLSLVNGMGGMLSAAGTLVLSTERSS